MEKRFLTPAETAAQIAENGRRVLTQPLSRTLVLSLLAGFYIAFGAELATLVTSDSAQHLGVGVTSAYPPALSVLGLLEHDLLSVCHVALLLLCVCCLLRKTRRRTGIFRSPFA